MKKFFVTMFIVIAAAFAAKAQKIESCPLWNAIDAVPTPVEMVKAKVREVHGTGLVFAPAKIDSIGNYSILMWIKRPDGSLSFQRVSGSTRPSGFSRRSLDLSIFEPATAGEPVIVSFAQSITGGSIYYDLLP